MEKKLRDYLIVGGVSAAAILASWWVFSISPAAAADLGGNCCADLEERIAELEAATARKGNRKVSLRVYGQVSKALLYVDAGGESESAVIENSAAESFVGFAGEARINQNWKAGYVLELGVGGFNSQEEFDFGSPDDADGIYTRRSFAYVEGPVGKLSLGLASQATDGVAELTVANTGVAARMLSLRPLNGPQSGDALDLFDGSRADVVRYDSPVFAGAVLSASWANGSEDYFGSKDSDVWDVALKWAGEGSGFRAIAGVGYRKGVEVPTVGTFASFSDEDVKVFSGSASLLHLETGLFLNVAAGKFEVGNYGDMTAYHVQGGVERKWNDLGKTTLFAEYGKSEVDNSLAWGLSYLDVVTADKLYGLGIIQTIDAAAMDVFLTGRRVTVEDEDADILMLGARVQF